VSLVYSYDGTPITHKVAPSGIQITHRADMGEASFGGIPIEDPAASLTMVGHKTFTVEEDDCAQPRLFTGWTTERDIGRDLDLGMFVGPDPRVHDTTIVDINAAFGFRQITGVDGNRPEETWAERLTWILESDYLDDAISHSQDFVGASVLPMDAADYRGSNPSSVMDDLSARTGDIYTYFLFWDPAESEIRLFFEAPTLYIAACTLSISNVYTDVDNATCFAPDSVAVLQREPDQTYSEVVVEYSHGTLKLFRSRPSTEAAYIRRGTSISRPYIGKASTAESAAEKWLDKHATEVDRITCSIQVPSSAAGLVQAGQSIAVRFSHMSEPYKTGATMRVVSCSPKPTDDTGYWYDIALELVLSGPTSTAFYFSGCMDVLGDSGEGLWTSGVSPTSEGGYLPDTTYPFSFTATRILGTANSTSWWLAFGITEGVEDPHFIHTWRPTTDVYPGTPFWDGPGPWAISGTFTTPDLAHWAWWDEELHAYASWGNIGHDGYTQYEVCWTMGGGGADVIIELPPAPGATTTHTTDPTVDDDETLGYTVGSIWVNETTGEAFILVDSTDGAAVWVSISGGTVYAPTTADYLVGTAQAGLSAEIVVGTTPGGELGGTWASPTVDATHSGSAHLALGSTSSTAAAGDHAHAATGTGELLISDTPSTPLIFADLIQNEAQDDLVYADI
jgi:hypothetical protein